ncbi:hypothetical protein [Streptomyces chartreusis]|uniref:hypothetical protein n=1 Tax=Streptomyces chartreusis TaxID=1969 RepID=UPI003629ED52
MSAETYDSFMFRYSSAADICDSVGCGIRTPLMHGYRMARQWIMVAGPLLSIKAKVW